MMNDSNFLYYFILAALCFIAVIICNQLGRTHLVYLDKNVRKLMTPIIVASTFSGMFSILIIIFIFFGLEIFTIR
jgi:hypothetical protein